MAEELWIPLLEYSIKHRVSISTLRRRIKEDKILYQFSEGKYFVKDDLMFVEKKTTREDSKPKQRQMKPDKNLKPMDFDLVDEIKKAFFEALQSKEEQIFHLKEEVSDLKTLVKVLEAYTEDLKRTLES